MMNQDGASSETLENSQGAESTSSQSTFCPPKPDGKMFMNRADAYIFDLAVILAAFTIFFVVTFRFLGPEIVTDPKIDRSELILGFLKLNHPDRWPFLVGVAIFWNTTYPIIFHVLGNASWGLMRQRLIVVDGQGKRISLAVTVARHWLSFLGIGLLGIGHLMALKNDQGQTLYDKITGSWVVRQKDMNFTS